ncbi:hypothetical protein F5883DRAFT_691204 [Diaporthe sp. PMI_573]|nr:hypothetical protein F5883DRAFT_691204 [Diaporthaceae sp. PMI_573]
MISQPSVSHHDEVPERASSLNECVTFASHLPTIDLSHVIFRPPSLGRRRRDMVGFCNTLDLTERRRSDFIRAANIRAPQLETAAGQERTTAETQPPEDLADELAPSPTHYATQIQHEEDSPDELALTPPGYLYEGDDSQDPPGVDPPTSLTTSFASSFDPHQSRPKRQRSPRSDAVESHTSKTRSRNTRRAKSSTTITGPEVAGTGESFQVWTYRKKGELCFLNMQEQEIRTEARDWTEQVLDDGSKRFHWQSPKSGRVFWTTALAMDPRKKRGGN